MVDDPMRSQERSVIAGCALAAVTVAGCAILALVRPQDVLGTAPIVMVKESGALYVRVGDTLHPALNLASARLIAGTAAIPQVLRASELSKARRGPLLGIPGARADPRGAAFGGVAVDGVRRPLRHDGHHRRGGRPAPVGPHDVGAIP